MVSNAILLTLDLTVIGGEAVNDVNVLPQSLLVLSRYQAWPDLTSTLTYPVKVIRGQEKVVWGHLTSYSQSSLLGCFYDQYLKEKNSNSFLIYW